MDVSKCGWCCKKLNESNVGKVDINYCLVCDGGRILTKVDFEIFNNELNLCDIDIDIDIDITLAVLMHDYFNINRLPVKQEIDEFALLIHKKMNKY